ncbi:MAG TPA: hypothetical protein VM580_07055, partial [Labilithrix sp.]|nr:hypothetical protein [Labilithrix sp.]
MRPISAPALAFGMFLVAFPGFGWADESANSRWGSATQQGQAGEPASESNDSGARGPSDEGAERKKATVPAAGYAYGSRASTASAGPAHPKYRKSGRVVNMPGFEATPDGGSRLFVQLSERVPVDERKANGTITYVLKGASPRVWNNTNALETIHFNTPVSRARLVPHGGDVHFVVELRTAASPTWSVSESKDKGVMLTIDFPKGDFMDAAATPASGKRERRATAGE